MFCSGAEHDSERMMLLLMLLLRVCWRWKHQLLSNILNILVLLDDNISALCLQLVAAQNKFTIDLLESRLIIFRLVTHINICINI